jgi:AcrR family transcriptional regulator
MSPRPRETPDADILAATLRVMTRLSPARLTLADVAREAGVVPATLIQRFGTKRALMLATYRAWSGSVGEQFAAACQQYGSPLQALVGLLVESTSFAATPEAVANGLAYVQNDLTDPEFHAITLEQFVKMRREIGKLLREAVRAGEISECDTRQLARLIESVYHGSMLTWAIHRQGSVAAWVRARLKTVLGPYLRMGKRVATTSKARGRGRPRHTN